MGAEVARYALSVVLAALAAPATAACKGQEDAPLEASVRTKIAAPVASSGVRTVQASAVGDVSEAVRQAASEASRERRRVVVYVGASWCEPCQKFHQAAAAGTLDAIFPDLTLLEFDLDRDRDRLNQAGYSPKFIPLFALAGPDGRASGRQVEGGIKGDAAVAFMAPRLKELLGQ
jgi:thiol-disulfide isomerase/thioredoxin